MRTRSIATNSPGSFGCGRMGILVAGMVALLSAAIMPTGMPQAQELAWAKRAGGAEDQSGGGIGVDSLGNSLVTGTFHAISTFGAGEDNQTVLSADGANDIFVAKYAPNGRLVWAKKAGGTDNEIAHDIAAGPADTSAIAGSFHGTVTFGQGEANETILSSGLSSDQRNVFIANYDRDGMLLWARRTVGLGVNTGLGAAVDDDGNVVVTGFFQGNAIFGEGEPNETVLASVGLLDLFVAKYAPNGELLWARRDGATSPNDSRAEGWDVDVDGLGNIFVAGELRGTVTFGRNEAKEITLNAGDGTNALVAKYAPDGTLLWATKAGGTEGSMQALGISTDLTGRTAVNGSFRGEATFGSGEANETTLISDLLDIFLAVYDPDGTLLWARKAGGENSDAGKGVAQDAAGNVIVTGWFRGTAVFGEGEANETTLTSAGRADIFVARYLSNGNLHWAKKAGGDIDDLGNGVALDAAGNAIATGLFRQGALFGEGDPSYTGLGSAGGADIFVAKWQGGGVLPAICDRPKGSLTVRNDRWRVEVAWMDLAGETGYELIKNAKKQNYVDGEKLDIETINGTLSVKNKHGYGVTGAREGGWKRKRINGDEALIFTLDPSVGAVFCSATAQFGIGKNQTSEVIATAYDGATEVGSQTLAVTSSANRNDSEPIVLDFGAPFDELTFTAGTGSEFSISGGVTFATVDQ